MKELLKKHRFIYFLTIMMSVISSFLMAYFAVRLGKVIDAVVNN